MDDTTKEELQKKFSILKNFNYEHLRSPLREISEPLCKLAYEMAATPTHQPAEMAAGLRKLLEAKDCFVRSALA